MDAETNSKDRDRTITEYFDNVTSQVDRDRPGGTGEEGKYDEDEENAGGSKGPKWNKRYILLTTFRIRSTGYGARACDTVCILDPPFQFSNLAQGIKRVVRQGQSRGRKLTVLTFVSTVHEKILRLRHEVSQALAVHTEGIRARAESADSIKEINKVFDLTADAEDGEKERPIVIQ